MRLSPGGPALLAGLMAQPPCRSSPVSLWMLFVLSLHFQTGPHECSLIHLQLMSNYAHIFLATALSGSISTPKTL